MVNEFDTHYSAGNSDNNTYSATIKIVNCVLNSPLILISITGNTLVLVSILRTPSLRSPSTILLCSLAVSDLVVGLVVQPLYILHYLTDNSSVYKIAAPMAFAACGVSLSTMSAISVDRFLALHYHMRYPQLMTANRAMFLSAVLWMIALLLSLLNFWQWRVYAVTVDVCLAICLLTCTAYYIKIYRIVRRHHLQIQVQQQAVASFNAENHQHLRQSRRSCKNTFIYYIVLIVCYTPLFISWLVFAISPSYQWPIEWILADTFAFMNSSINPPLYCWRHRELRGAVVRTARQVLCKQTVQN